MRQSERGQATVEFVALLPLLGLLALAVWQAALAGHTIWSASSAARAASRVVAVGGEPDKTVRHLAGSRARVHTARDGAVRVTVPIPAVAGGADLTTFTTTARFEPQR